jgi:DNA-binding XRE family transcriptional regulator
MRFTQQDLAARAGISRTAFARIEAGTADPRPSTTRKLARSLGVTVEDLMAPLGE